MAFVYADRVKETTQTTGNGQLSLDGAATGYQSFVAGIGGGNTCPYVIEDANGTAWEVGIGTVTDATPDKLDRSLIASSTGSLIVLSTGTHNVFCDWIAARAQRSAGLYELTGTDAATTCEANRMHVVDMSGWATADRNYTMPASPTVGDRVGIMISSGNATYALVIKGNTSQTINGGSAASEWSRLFITGESVVLRYTASNTWIVERDGRIASRCLMRLSTDTSTNETANTWTSPTAASGAWTADYDSGGMAETGNDRFKIRRAGNYDIYAQSVAVNAVSDQKKYGVALWLNGTSTLITTNQIRASSGASGELVFAQSIARIQTYAVNDTINYQFISEEGSRLLDGATYLRSYFYGREVF